MRIHVKGEARQDPSRPESQERDVRLDGLGAEVRGLLAESP